MRTPIRHRHVPSRRALVTAACLAVVTSLLLATPSSSAPDDPVPAAGPGEVDLPQTPIAVARGVVTNSQGAVVRRSKMYLTIKPEDPIWGILYNGLYNAPIVNNAPVENPTGFLPLCIRGRPCLPNPFYQPSCATDDPATQRRGPYARILLYPVSPLPGGGVDVGLLAEMQVNLIAFGALPATATLTLRVPRVDGKVQPLLIHLWSVGPSGRGCDPSFVAPDTNTRAEGQVEISLADLEVDGVPVDLGPNCRTERPADLALWGETELGGYFPGSGGNLGAYDGLHPGSMGPLDSPFYFEDNGRVIPPSTGITIPPFTGCGSGSEDLSALVTAMASGPNNPVRARQGPLITQVDGSLDLNDLTKCMADGPGKPPICPLPAPAVPDRPPLPDGDEE